MSSTKSSSSMSTSNSQANCLDPLDSLIDFSDYETVSYKSELKSPALSPSTSMSGFSRSVSSTPANIPSQPTLSGPSHNYELYRQTTGIPPGSVANTLAVNQSLNQFGFTDSYLAGLSPSDDFVDFGTAPTQTSFNTSDIDMDFDSPTNEPAFFFSEQTSDFIDPSTIGANHGLPSTQMVSTQSGNVGRLWPGMHQKQAAIAKAQAQQKQQQAIITQQRQQALGGQQPRQQSQRPRASHAPSDPIVEEKISQLLNSMRQNSEATDSGDADTPNASASHASRMRKEEEEMDEDERLLASEEGKKLSSKERRQLRNKVSARAFRSRRKGKPSRHNDIKTMLTIHRIHQPT